MARHRKLTQKFAGFPIFKVGTSGDTFPVTSPFTTEFTGYGDGLSLDLQFATDKTLTARKGPTPVFTRASTATFVGSNGLIQSAAINAARFDHDPIGRTNLLSYSEQFDNENWIKYGSAINEGITCIPNVGIAPNNLFTADQLVITSTALGVNLRQNVMLSAGTYTWSIYVRKISGSATNWFLDISDTDSTFGEFTGEWQRISCTKTVSSASFVDLILGVSSGTGVFNVWGAQLEFGSTVTNYIPTTSNPVTVRDCKGLLIEESRTNLILRSENFANASWVKAGGSISSVANISPDGSANSELFSEDGTTGSHRIFQSFAGTIGTVYTLSVFLKFNGRAEVALENRSITGNPSAVFNIQNGTVGLVSAGLTAAIQAYPNGWYRCSITGTATLAGGNYLINGYSGSTTYIGLNGPAFYIYGAQVEAGSFPTSYIPTVASSVVRSADVCSITGADFSGFYNQSEGSVFFSGSSAAKAASATFGDAAFYLNIFSDTSNRISMFSSAGISRVEIKNANVNQYVASRSYTNNVRTKQILGYSSGQLSSGFNDNVSMTASANITLTSPTVTSMELGRAGSGINHINGHIVQIRYFRKRLSDAKLQAITA